MAVRGKNFKGAGCAHNGNDGMLEYWNDERKIYFPVDFLSLLYYIKILNGSGKFIFRKAKKMNSRAGSRGSNKEVSGAKKRRPEEVEKGSESGKKWVSSGRNWDGKL